MSSGSRSAPSTRSVAIRGTPTSARTPPRDAGSRARAGRCWKAPEKQSAEQLALLAEVQQANRSLYRAFLLKEELRLLYQLQRPTLAPAHLDAWLAWASRSKLEPFVKLARTIRLHRHGILAAIPSRAHQRAP
jgi:transposase